MANIIIRSDEANAAATALTLATRGHSVCLQASSPLPGEQSFSFLGDRRTVNFLNLDELDASASNIAVIFAEGEDVEAGVRSTFKLLRPELLVIVGGGITAAVDAADVARNLNYELCRVLLIGAFIVNGNGAAVKAEKQNVLSGFLAQGTPADVQELAENTFPQIAIDDAFEAALSSTNAFFHLPPMILNAMSIERGDDIRMYVEGFGNSVSRLLLELDNERLRLGAALGRDLLPIEKIHDSYRGIVDNDTRSLTQKVNSQLSTQSAKLPSSFHHRFLSHELRSTFAPMYEIARSLGIEVPTIQSVVTLGQVLLDEDLEPESVPAAKRFLELIDAKGFVPL